MLTAPVVPASPKNIMTNSAKYAHYAPALVRRRVRFGDLETCVEVACSGLGPIPPAWVARVAREEGTVGGGEGGRGFGLGSASHGAGDGLAAEAACGSCRSASVARW